MRMRRWDDAAAAFAKAAAALPDNPDLQLRQAAALIRAGKHEDARDVLLAVESEPQDARIQFLLVDVNRSLRDFESAERAARRVIAIEPSRASGYQSLAQVLADRREHRAIVDALAPAFLRLESKEDARSLVSLRVSLGIARLQVPTSTPASPTSIAPGATAVPIQASTPCGCRRGSTPGG